MSFQRDVRAQLDQVIREETKWLRHYESEVVNNFDTLKKGRVKVVIPELGFYTEDKGMWCFPRQGNSMSVPEKGSWVDVYFASGDPNKPRYLHYASEMDSMIPSKFDGQPATRVIFESPITKESIKYSDDTKELVFLEGTEPFVLGNILKTTLTNLISAIEALTVVTGGVPSGVPVNVAAFVAIRTNLSTIISLLLKGK